MKCYIKSSTFHTIDLNQWIEKYRKSDFSDITIRSSEFSDPNDNLPDLLFAGSMRQLISGRGDNFLLDFWLPATPEYIHEAYSLWIVIQEDIDGEYADLIVEPRVRRGRQVLEP